MGCIASCCASAACAAVCPVCCWCRYKDCFGFESVRAAKIPYLVLLFLSAALAVLLKAGVFEFEILADLGEDCDSDFTERCEENQRVYRVSFSAFVFFAVMTFMSRFSTTIHTHWWIPKVMIYALLFIVSFMIPNSFFNGYVQLSRVLSGFYLLMQIVIFINFAYWLHDWLNSSAAEGAGACSDMYLIAYLGLSVASFITAIVGISLIFVYFAVPGCGLYQFLTSWTLILGLVGIVLSIYEKVNMGLLTPCVVFLYCVYVLWDALISGPDDECNPTATSGEGNNEVAIIVISLILTAGSITWTSWRTGEALMNIEDQHVDDLEEGTGGKKGDMTMSDNMRDIVTGDENKNKSNAAPRPAATEETPLAVGMGTTEGKPIEDPAGEWLWLFHGILALAAAYLSMAITNWGATDGENEESAPNAYGYTNVWVKIASQWLTFALYFWSLTAPWCRGEDNSAGR
mmetsp:Transcript_29233/g.93648  ORF Transcript_29233/g.93648 Transcript_29233/m.93648 type:complete len:459 (-) Transcript_29233:1486-2862(-)|eukprot:CAMPEP_0118852126 /NCGR_PEP_ID=MMETSP1163-20130328/1278_1 /TAXON_ID=124430 /ORGANISM="Phaeomonas parva, Strain CCMP2877" /LENGTH=458 /DNA_ID=CAMNT_0006784533 /DNA_START=230 /DNA_END=1606 /DNA_ORIENTATION=-